MAFRPVENLALEVFVDEEVDSWFDSWRVSLSMSSEITFEYVAAEFLSEHV